MNYTEKSNLSTFKKPKPDTRHLALIGLMAAITCILGPLTLPLPFSPIPISLTNLAIYISVYVLGWKRGTVSYIIYLVIGLVGLPVFSSFTGGPGKLFGPTGGFLIGFLFMSVISGLFIERWFSKPLMCLLGMLLGNVVCYFFGTLWLAKESGMTFYQSLLTGVVPFLPGDCIKIFLAHLLGSQIRLRLQKAGLI